MAVNNGLNNLPASSIPHVLNSLINLKKKANIDFFHVLISSSMSRIVELTITSGNKEICYNGKNLLEAMLMHEQYHSPFYEELKRTLKMTSNSRFLTRRIDFRFVDIALGFIMGYKFLQVNIRIWIDILIINPAFYFLRDGSDRFEDRLGAFALEWLMTFITRGKQIYQISRSPLFRYLYGNRIDKLASLIDYGEWFKAIQLCFYTRLESELQSNDLKWGSVSAQLFVIKACTDTSFIPALFQMEVGGLSMDIRAEALRSLEHIYKNHDITTWGPQVKLSFPEAFDKAICSETALLLNTGWNKMLSYLPIGVDIYESSIYKLIERTLSDTPDEWTRVVAMRLLTSLASHAPHVFKKHMITPPTLELTLKNLNLNWSVGLRWLELLTSLKQLHDFHIMAQETLLPVLQEMRKLMGKSKLSAQPFVHGQSEIIEILGLESIFFNIQEYITIVRVLGFLTEYFPREMRNAVLLIGKIAERHDNEDVCSSAMMALVPLSQIEHFKQQVQHLLLNKPELLSKRREGIHDIWINKFEELALQGRQFFSLIALRRIANHTSYSNYSERTRIIAIKVLASLVNYGGDKVQDSMFSMLSNVIPKTEPSAVCVEWIKLFRIFAQKKSFQNILRILFIMATQEVDAISIEALDSLIYLAKSDGIQVYEAFEKYVSLHYLDSILVTNSKFNLTALSSSIKSGLNAEDAAIRHVTIQVIESVAATYKDNFTYPVMESVLALLLRMIVTEEGDIQFKAESAFESIMETFETQSNDHQDRKILHSALAEIPGVLPIGITRKGMEFVLRFALRYFQGIDGDEDRSVIPIVAGNLIPTLRRNSWLSRATAIALITHLYTGYTQHCLQLVRLTIPDIISVVLDDKVEEVRLLALKLLIQVVDRDSYSLHRIKESLEGFMLLLDIDNILQLPASQLLSSMSKDKSIRELVVKKIISLGLLCGKRSFTKGYESLLLQLLMDGRLSKTAIDPPSAEISAVSSNKCFMVLSPRSYGK
ncbi:armadillo-type protein [Cyathus striatus]|nr:armadillo-type protein [Cyathus striatus]